MCHIEICQTYLLGRICMFSLYVPDLKLPDVSLHALWSSAGAMHASVDHLEDVPTCIA